MDNDATAPKLSVDPFFLATVAASCNAMPRDSIAARLGPLKDKDDNLFGWDFLVGRYALRQAQTLERLIRSDAEWKAKKAAERNQSSGDGTGADEEPQF